MRKLISLRSFLGSSIGRLTKKGEICFDWLLDSFFEGAKFERLPSEDILANLSFLDELKTSWILSFLRLCLNSLEYER